MMYEIDFPILDTGYISSYILNRGFTSFVSFAMYIKSLPFGRTSSKGNLLSVIEERKGTCSSKHLLLASLAVESGKKDIRLMIGIYKMSQRNTPGIDHVIKKSGFPYIPEAHCYIKKKEKRYDFTGFKEGEDSPFKSLILEQITAPDKLYEVKELLHDNEIRNFAKKYRVSPQKVWNIREECIQALSINNSH